MEKADFCKSPFPEIDSVPPVPRQIWHVARFDLVPFHQTYALEPSRSNRIIFSSPKKSLELASLSRPNRYFFVQLATVSTGRHTQRQREWERETERMGERETERKRDGTTVDAVPILTPPTLLFVLYKPKGPVTC